MEPLEDTLACHPELLHYFPITVASYKPEVLECCVLQMSEVKQVASLV
jgi:hypothetical protein